MKKKNNFNYLIYGLIGTAILLLAYVLSSSNTVRAAFYISVFIVINMIIASYKKFIKMPIEVEVLTLGIVVVTLRFGVKAGLVVAILGGILSFIVGFNISPFSFPMLLGYISTAIITFLFRGLENITLVGMIGTIANNLLVFLWYHFVFDYDLFKNLSFSISNIIFNAIIFLNIAPFLAAIIH